MHRHLLHLMLQWPQRLAFILLPPAEVIRSRSHLRPCRHQQPVSRSIFRCASLSSRVSLTHLRHRLARFRRATPNAATVREVLRTSHLRKIGLAPISAAQGKNWKRIQLLNPKFLVLAAGDGAVTPSGKRFFHCDTPCKRIVSQLKHSSKFDVWIRSQVGHSRLLYDVWDIVPMDSH